MVSLVKSLVPVLVRAWLVVFWVVVFWVFFFLICMLYGKGAAFWEGNELNCEFFILVP